MSTKDLNLPRLAASAGVVALAGIGAFALNRMRRKRNGEALYTAVEAGIAEMVKVLGKRFGH